MNGFRAAWWIATKDLRVSFRDRTGMLLGFGLPIVLILVFGFVYQMTFGSSGGMSRTTLWVVDQDDSPQSRALVERLRGSELLAVRPRPGDAAPDAPALQRKVEDGEAHHALVVEPGFAAELSAGRFPRLTLYRDSGRDLESRLVSIGLMQGFLATDTRALAPLLTARALEAAGLPAAWNDRMLAVSRGFSDSVERLFTEADAAGLLPAEPAADASADADSGAPDFSAMLTALVPVERVDLAPPERPRQLSYMLAHNLAGVSVMMLMFGLVACGTLLLAEREDGTLQRLLIAAVPRASILGGKFLFTALMGAAQLALLFLIGGFVFGVDLLRDPVTLLVISTALILAVTSFGILVASLARTTRQAEGLATLVILVMSAVGGAWFPLYMFDLPLAGEIATRCTLTWWAMSAFQGLLWHGKAWSDPAVLRDVLVLLAFAAGAATLASFAFRRRYRFD